MKTTSSCAAAWRRRLEFLVQDTSRLAEPTDDDLRRFYEANPDRFQARPKVSFTQVYFSPSNGARTRRGTRKGLAELSHSPPTARPSEFMGDHLLDPEMLDADVANRGRPVRRGVRTRCSRPEARRVAWPDRIGLRFASRSCVGRRSRATSSRSWGSQGRRFSTSGAPRTAGGIRTVFRKSLLKKYVVVMDEERETARRASRQLNCRPGRQFA